MMVTLKPGHIALGLMLPVLAMVLVVTALLSAPQQAAANGQIVLDWENDLAGNPLLPGQVIDDEFHSTTGISITILANSHASGGSDVRAIFPSYQPPVDARGNTIDPDLGTPNNTCPGGGPGIGVGGQVGQPGENCTPQGNVLIIPTIGDADGDGFIDGLPDDDEDGGLATFLFSEPVFIDYLAILDQEGAETADIRTYTTHAGAPGDLIKELSTSPLGNNSYQRLDVNAAEVMRLDVDYEGSGALALLAFTPKEPSAVEFSTTGATAKTAAQRFGIVLIALSVLTVFAYRRPRRH